MSDKYGKIAQVIGPVVDVIFEGDMVPPIYTALKIDREDGSQLILEVEQHIGEDTVRCVAMESTDGLRRGMRVDNLERPIAVPTGDQVKGRLLNVLGNAIDDLGADAAGVVAVLRAYAVDDLPLGRLPIVLVARATPLARLRQRIVARIGRRRAAGQPRSGHGADRKPLEKATARKPSSGMLQISASHGILLFRS